MIRLDYQKKVDDQCWVTSPEDYPKKFTEQFETIRQLNTRMIKRFQNDLNWYLENESLLQDSSAASQSEIKIQNSEEDQLQKFEEAQPQSFSQKSMSSDVIKINEEFRSWVSEIIQKK